MFESRNAPLLSREEFLRRMAASAGVASVIIAVSLTVGTIGYSVFGELKVVDAFLNASMILTGMGPVDPMKRTPGKVFSAFYALFSGIAFLTMMTVLLAPLVHRFLHKFHLAEDDDDKD